MKKKLALLSLGGAFCFVTAQTAHGATVTFQDFDTALGLFQVAGINGNTLSLDVSLFVANANQFVPVDNKSDLISFDIVAPAGYYIQSISYAESLQTSIDTHGAGFAATIATGGAVVDGKAISFGTHIYTLDTSHAFSLGVSDYVLPDRKTSIDVVLNNQITASAFAGAESMIMKGPAEASIDVTLAPVPVPATLWLFGSAVAALLTGKRKRPEA